MISRTPELESASIAWSAVSVTLSSSSVSASMRATSAATLPLPITTATRVGEVELVVGEVGMGVVPGDELGGGVRSGQVLTGNPELAVGGGAVGIDDSVVALGQLLGRDVAADLYVAVKGEAVAGRCLRVDANHRFDLRVVGRHACPHEAERCRQPVEHVDLDGVIGVAEQVLSRVKPGRPRADDGNAKRVFRRTEGAHRAGKGSGVRGLTP